VAGADSEMIGRGGYWCTTTTSILMLSNRWRDRRGCSRVAVVVVVVVGMTMIAIDHHRRTCSPTIGIGVITSCSGGRSITINHYACCVLV